MEHKLNGSTVLITGGTGSFGQQLVGKLLQDYTCKKIIILSRDEKKQYEMRNDFNNNPTLSFIIGDVREKDVVFKNMRHVDYVFHAAALKQVPSCEFFPYEATKTNISGTVNVLDAAEENHVKRVVVLSTDKAVYPINAMGMTKAIMEKVMLAKARTTASKTIFCGVRYGNVLYSRGSILPVFIRKIQQNKPLTITNPDMTRYLLPLPIAIDLVMFALEHGENGDILVRKSESATVGNIAKAVTDVFNYQKEPTVIGIREGEKMHETLVTQEELIKAFDHGDYYRIKNLEKINYEKFFTKGNKTDIPEEGYTSANTKMLSYDETKNLILSLKEVQQARKELGITHD